MKEIINFIAILVFSGALLFGTGYTINEAFLLIRKEALTKVSQGLSSSETLASALTKGER